ncbi:MAG: hypothetical protein G01um101430_182 [Parcubacteria group bacterium Gr01-1014_30]|nr:MAG: hypothetical protein G01um101430_182 [Parcubacteria group bacterium Gr01-1014_30]
MEKKSRHQALDYFLAGSLFFLLLLGIVMLASVSASLSLERFGNTYYFMNRQLIFGIFPGVVVFLLFWRMRLDLLKKWTPLLLFLNILLMAMVFLPKVGLTLGGATRWLYFGGPMTFQPSEFLKLTFVLYLASFMSARTEKSLGRDFVAHRSFAKKRVEFTQTFLAFLTVMGLISLLLIFQPDISTLGIIVLSAVLIYFSSGTPLWHTISMVTAGALTLYALIKIAPYRANRWLVFMDPEREPLGIGYQLKQAFIAVGSGGIFGLGLGLSRQKFGFLPQSMTDSIFAVFSEETGFFGAFILIFLFLIFLWRSFTIAKRSQDQFSKLVALGISSWICLQAFANIGTMVGVLPLAGVPLPFISYGGSHLVAEMAGAGILLNISNS